MPYSSPYPLPSPIPEQNHHYGLSGLKTPETPDYVLHIDGVTGQKRTRKEFDERVLLGLTALAAPTSRGGLGLDGGVGDVVGILSFNCLDYVTLIHSSLAAAVPYGLIPPYATEFELNHILKTLKPSRLFVQPELLEKTLKAVATIGLSPEKVYILEGRSEKRQSFGDLIDTMKVRKILSEPVRPATKDTIAYFVFSSGTSGLPKAVMATHGNLWASMFQAVIVAQETAKALKMGPPATPLVWLATLPFSHAYGMHIFCLRGFFSPATFVILPKWNIHKTLRAISRYRINMVALVPSLVHHLVMSGLLEKADFSSVVQVMSGASHTPQVLIDELVKYVKGMSDTGGGYGLSEATLAVCMKPAPGYLDTPTPSGSCGILVPGVQARIVKEDGTDAALNEPGEIWVRGDNVIPGYYGNEKATKETFIDGWLHTGDRMYTDGTFFFFVERMKDTMKVSGSQVSPTEIEDVLRTHPGGLITDVCVAGVSGGRTSDEKLPRAFIVLSEKGKKVSVEQTMQEMTKWVEDNLSRYKWLKGGVEIIDAVPKNPTGKVLRRVLVDNYEERVRSAPKAKL
ncbi:hypothetical protein QCA50_014585 [Cerrena zonata]|uniref:Uncharacterized protein n=1 Tax=Cerrena zonata TaxID=2478898 RepID=A0AAW0FLY3_9APHY